LRTRSARSARIELAVVLLTIQAIVINRHAGLDYPIWALRER
jgi:hypothetical protein